MRKAKRIFKRTSTKLIAWSIILFVAIYSVASVLSVKADELSEEQMADYRAEYAQLEFSDVRRIEDNSTSERVVLDYGSGNVVTVEGTDLVYGYHSIDHSDEIWGDFTETFYYVYALGDVVISAVPTEGYSGVMRLNGDETNNPSNVINFEGLSAGDTYSMFGEFDDGIYHIHFENAIVGGNDVEYQFEDPSGGMSVFLHVNGADVTEGELSVSHEDQDTISFQLDENFDPEFWHIEVTGDYGYQQELVVDENNVATLQGLNLPNGWLWIRVFNPGDPAEDPIEDPENHDYEIFIDGIMGFEENIATVYYNDINVRLAFDGGEPRNNDRYVIDNRQFDDLEITVLDNFDPDTMDLVLHGNNDYRQVLAIEDGVATFRGLYLPQEQWIHLSIEGKNIGPGPGPNPEPTGNTQAQIILSGGEGSFIDEWYFYNEETGQEELIQETVYYSHSFGGVEFAINHGEILNNLPVTFENGMPSYASGTAYYDSEESDETVTLTVITSWHEYLYDEIVINGTSYKVSDYMNYSDRESWLNHLDQLHILFDIPNVPKADTYEIQVKKRSDGQKFLGVFLWTADPNQEYEMCWNPDLQEYEYCLDNEGNRIPGPNYIGHSSLELVKATYTVGGVKYTITKDEIDAGVDEGGHYISPDGYLDFSHFPGYDFEEGGLTVPDGSEITMRVVPEYGYQVVRVNGGENFTTTENGVSEFTVTVNEGDGGGFYFTADVVPVEDEVKVESSKVDSGMIYLGNALDSGTAQLRVHDIELSANKIAGFEEAAGDYTIANYIDLDLYQVFYRGTEDSDYTWDNKIDELDNEATISIVLADGINAEDIVIVHNIHDGDEYEIIHPISYNAETRTLTFKSNSFSNYAVAYLNGEVVERQEISRIDVTVNTAFVQAGVELTNDLFNSVQVDNENVIVVAHAYMEMESDKYYIDNDMFAPETVLETFEDGKSYAFGVVLYAKDGYKLTENTKVYINGEEAQLQFEEGEMLVAIQTTPIVLDSSEPIGPGDPTDPDIPGDIAEAPEVTPKSGDDNSKAASEAANKVVEKVFNGEEVEELDEALKDKIVDAINNNDDISVELATEEVKETQVEEADLKIIKEKVEDESSIIGYFDIDVNVYVNDVEVGQLTKLTEPIKVTLDVKELVEKLPEVPAGYTRVYKVIRIHNGVADELNATLDANGKLVFQTDRFSTYTVTYTDVAQTTTPSTGDNLLLYVSLLLISGAVLGATGLYLKRSKRS